MAVSFEIATRRIKVGPEGFFDVRGLNTEDFTYLTTHYLDDLKEAVARHATPSGRVKQDNVAAAILDVVSHFPRLAAEIISRCADAPEETEKFSKLSVVTTVEALQAILELTSADGGTELKKVGAGLVAILEANGLHLGPLATQLRNIIDSAASKSPS